MAAWDLMGNRLEMAALPVIVELLEVQDVQRLVVGLQTIRNYCRESA